MSNVFNKPDLKAKRYGKKSCAINIPALVTAFKKKHPQYNTKLSQSKYRSEYAKIIDQFTLYMKNKVLETRDGVELPEGLGYIMITSHKTKKKLLNKKQSEIHGIKIYETNLHTDSFRAKISYTNDKMKYRLSNRDMWGFEAARTFKREVSKVFRENWTLFARTDNNRLCRVIDRNIKSAPLFDPETTYNEFDI